MKFIFLLFTGILLIHFTPFGEACENVYIQNKLDEVVNGTVFIQRGGLLILNCNGSCQGTGYTPNLKWYTPSGEKVSSFPGRIMSVYQRFRRSRKLFVQRFRWRDQGTYTCEGMIHGYFRKTSVKVLIRGTSSRWRTRTRSTRATTTTTPLPDLPDARIQ